MEDGYVHLFRSIESWEHSDQLAMIGFWVRLLVRASWKDTPKLKRGELIITAPLFASICHCSERTVRKYLHALEESGEITTERSGNWTKIRIVNWDTYQPAAETGTRVGTKAGTEGGTRAGKYFRSEDEPYPYKEIKKEERRNSYMANPTLDQIREYIYTENLMVDPEKFFDYYESQGWKLSNGNRMKDWKATCRNWHRKEVEKMNKEKKGVLPF